MALSSARGRGVIDVPFPPGTIGLGIRITGWGFGTEVKGLRFGG